MALTPGRRTSQLTFLLLAVMAALLSGLALADGADDKMTVRYSPFTIEEPVRYEVFLHIVSVGNGGFESEFDPSNNTFYQRLTGSSNDLGDVLTLVSTSGKPKGVPVYENEFVYVASRHLRPSLVPVRWWGWRKEGETEWFLVETSKDKRAEFKFVTAPCVRLNYCYFLQSCPGSFCSNIHPYPEDEVIYIKLGEENLKGGLRIMLKQVNKVISMPTDA